MNPLGIILEPSVPVTEAEMTLHLGLFAVEGLFGKARTRLEAGYHVDEQQNAIVVNASGDVGAALVKVFTRLLVREFGEYGFHVRRVGSYADANLSAGASNAQGARTPVAA